MRADSTCRAASKGFDRSCPPPSPRLHCQVSRKSPVCLSPPVVNAPTFLYMPRSTRVIVKQQQQKKKKKKPAKQKTLRRAPGVRVIRTTGLN